MFENMYMQYFIGYSSFSDKEPFDPSLFVEFHKRLGMEQINAINEKILHLATQQKVVSSSNEDDNVATNLPANAIEESALPSPVCEEKINTHQGKLIVDATHAHRILAIPQI